ncbi:MAG TPA: pyridoxamine 5'-phosphate oxidase [Acidimicrobiales bacterium]|nr:pyridoxamine 5'-phosphate oxidase [Acidimicrobiales bacterium]
MFEDELGPDPITQFDAWYQEAGTDVVCLATASADGSPSARMVLLKGHGERGFDFYTNFDSGKGHDLNENPRAALVFHWLPERQVRVAGTVTRIADDEAEAYWRNRPRASQLSAWASKQSQVVDSRAALEQEVQELDTRFPDDVPKPPFWGGYRLEPETIEFWHHRDDRLHDRLRYRRQDQASAWIRERLAP